MRDVIIEALPPRLQRVARVGRVATVLALIAVGAVWAEKRHQERRAAMHNPVSAAEIGRIERGASESDTLRALGRPTGVHVTPSRLTRLLYYEVEGGQAGDRWQLVFQDGRMTARRRF